MFCDPNLGFFKLARYFLNPVILSEPESAPRDEDESKDPVDASRTTLPQGILP